ncbi:MAG: ABC transporter ATP-binding protein, partial [Acidisphaera sp.]|nr:ABC transporter ATP-binding protein [Acidisphaera sp.]
MLSFFERLLPPTRDFADGKLPQGLGGFYWHYARQAGWLIVALFAAGLLVAALDTTIPLFIGRVVSLVSSQAPAELLARHWPTLLGMALVLLVARPVALLGQFLVTNQVIAGGLTNMIRWQNHFHVVRQSWSFFQNDFAGRIASRVMQTGPALRESIVSAVNAVWYIVVYGSGAMLLLGATDWRLTLPILAWFAVYIGLLRCFVPRMRERSRANSASRAQLTGRVVDSYSNILTVKLFARARDEDAFVRDGVDEQTATFRRQLRLTTGFGFTLAVVNASLVVGTAATALWLWRDGRIAVGTV